MYMYYTISTCMHVYIYMYIYIYTVFTRILAAATINFSRARVRLLIEGGSYSRAALIKITAHVRACNMLARV